MSHPQPRRRPSFKLSTYSANVPVPPSLLTSPYVTSPESIFRREICSLCLPSEADEQWLQDTIPLTNGSRVHNSRGHEDEYAPVNDSGFSSTHLARPAALRPCSRACTSAHRLAADATPSTAILPSGAAVSPPSLTRGAGVSDKRTDISALQASFRCVLDDTAPAAAAASRALNSTGPSVGHRRACLDMTQSVPHFASLLNHDPIKRETVND
ncbi:hypothetical protein AX15_003126 [Amanita polypyramis BW_CC]|nr:hypothetical protein AX15_003126 [Amanita polypyramis BW_CC]